MIKKTTYIFIILYFLNIGSLYALNSSSYLVSKMAFELNDFENLAAKYGTDTFETYIKDLYNNYPSPEDQSTIDYIRTSNRNSIFLISHKWRLISELFSSIHNYFEDKGVTL